MDISGISSMYNTAKTDSSSAAADSLQSSLNNVSADSSEEELKGVIKHFGSYFVEQMLKQMKDTFTSDEDEDGTMSQYKDLFMDKAIEQMADEVVDQVGENVTQQLYEQMRRNLNPNIKME